MLIKSKPMEKHVNMNHINSENINIIKKIIDDFEHAGEKKSKCYKTKKISNSDSFIHKYKKSQISPKTTSSLDGNIIRYKPSPSFEDFLKNSDVYLNIVENCDNENADANAFRRIHHRKSVFNKSNSSGKKFSADIEDFQKFMDSQSNRDRVNRNYNEVCMIYFL